MRRLSALAFAFTFSNAQADVGYKDYVLGTEKFALNTAGFRCQVPQNPTVGDEACLRTDLTGDTIAGVPAKGIFLMFVKGRLEGISVRFAHSDAARVEAAFLEKYGTPAQRSEQSLSNAMGAKFKATESVWMTESVEITLQPYSSKIDIGAVTYLSEAYRANAKAKRQERPVTDAKDL